MNSSLPSLASPRRIAIIGGGISGLAAAQRFMERAPNAQVTLYEASGRLGGILRTTRADGFVFEHSADSFIVNDELPWAGELCEKLKVELIPTSTQYRGALILRDGQFHPVPDGLQLMSVRNLTSMMTTPLLSWSGRFRVAEEAYVPRKTDDAEESLQQFATRRYGQEMFERIIQPLVSGIYTADPRKLSVAAALPQYVRQEEKYGSLARAAIATSKSNAVSSLDGGARYSLFRSPRNGMDSLIEALETKLSGDIEIRKNDAVQSVENQKTSTGRTWSVTTRAGVESYDAVVCALRASVVSQLLETANAELSQQLHGIDYVSTAVVCLGYRRDQVAHALNAFGAVIPAIESRKILAISFTNVKFPTRAPADSVLLRVFVGGALQPEVARLEDDALQDAVQRELHELLGVRGAPTTSLIVRWPKTTPQYHLGHLQRVANIERLTAAMSGLELAGSAYRGTGIPQCVRGGWQAADRILSGA